MKKVKLSLTAEEAAFLRGVLKSVYNVSKQEANRRRRIATYKLGCVYTDEMKIKHQESVRANIAVAYRLEKQCETMESIEERLSFEMVNKKIKLFKK